MNRRNLIILVLLAFLSNLLTEFLTTILASPAPIVDILIETFLFILLFYLFDRYFWRWFGFAKQTDMHGDWRGRLNTSRTENTEVETISVRIHQHWLTSRVEFIAPHSSSSSLAAVFYPYKDGQALAYIYRSQPYEGEETIVIPHVGLNIFYPVEKGKLSGYFHHLEADEAGVKLTHGQVVLTRA